MDKIQKPSFSTSNSVAGASVTANQQNYGNVGASVPGTVDGTAVSHSESEINSTWNASVNSGKRKEGVDSSDWTK
jgi:hypothetical protein